MRERDCAEARTSLTLRVCRCAYADTPKLRALRAAEAASGARPARVVTADWLERCAALQRRLPWRRFATEPKHRGDALDSDAPDDEGDSGPSRRPRRRRPSRGADARPSDSDTDDEIRRALARRGRRSTSPGALGP